ncbi:hypothetical protein PUNSTDRAFT_138449 [Punctularia strigosozonata HHB-11173 SS5]|uniref:Uncharacterized protein n=1 Tax=Punctularia strigosozonata (strain HHB-11173) TaxID=741275 RepID=R7S2H4_PUNST|nr:uncharacterized protein PUNSTDRAFT_138449 [Punctularia strigosozonata HHB-11173 SS5]EIN04408.1 hypothetical protein PUNSTDRAFT_138449 [Punctularia strigosozonata HHB-11173 SS5]
MPQVHWDNDELAFVKEQLKAYLSCKGDRNAVTEFWLHCMADYFMRWPVVPSKTKIEEAGSLKEAYQHPEYLTRKRSAENKVRNWINNRGRATSGAPRNGCSRVLDLTGSKRRPPQLWQALARLKREEWRDEIAAGWRKYKEEHADEALDQRDYLKFLHRLMTERLNAIDEQTMQLVEEYRDSGYLRDEDAPDFERENSDVDPETAKARSYEEALSNVPHTLKVALQRLQEQTGWCALIIMGGPRPSRGGSLNTYSISIGQTLNGNTFQAAYKGYPDFEEAYAKFLERVYTPEECAARALKEPDNQSTDKDVIIIVDDQAPSTNTESSIRKPTPRTKTKHSRTNKHKGQKKLPDDPLDSASISWAHVPRNRDRSVDSFEGAPPRLPPSSPVTSASPSAPEPDEPRKSSRSGDTQHSSPSADGGALLRSSSCATSPHEDTSISVPSTESRQTPPATSANDTTTKSADDTAATSANDTAATSANDTAATSANDTTTKSADDTAATSANDTAATSANDTSTKLADDTAAASADDTAATSADDTAATSADDAAATSPAPTTDIDMDTLTGDDDNHAKSVSNGGSHSPSADSATSKTIADAVAGPYPEWFTSSMSWMDSLEHGGLAFKRLLAAYADFEISLGFAETKALTTSKKRPEAVRHWLGRGRKLTKPPPTGPATSHLQNWTAWWCDIQPSWREGTELPLRRPTMSGTIPEWSAQRGGPNGLYMVVLCLAWCLIAEGSVPGGFDSACDDVAWMLRLDYAPAASECTPTRLESPKKRKDEGNSKAEGRMRK